MNGDTLKLHVIIIALHVEIGCATVIVVVAADDINVPTGQRICLRSRSFVRSIICTLQGRELTVVGRKLG
jgi:hypothetical protein